MRKSLAITAILSFCAKVICQFHECLDDPEESPESGPLNEPKFSWLGALQYIHVKTGAPHYFRVPRAVLISRQFCLCTAVDAAEIPINYALGNVAFGDYERDEIECGITPQQAIDGQECDSAILVMPIADVLIHPEYKHFKAKNSVALLKLIKPIKSAYMLPACLPFKNYLIDNTGKQTKSKMIHIDFTTDVPRDFSEEEKEIKRILLLPKEICYLFDPKSPQNETLITRNRMMCTTGCGFHSGAPTLVHEHTGHWSIVSLATGGSQCPDPLRNHRPPKPPQHIVIFPYVPWITAAITGKPIGAFAKDDPFGYVMPRTDNDYGGFKGFGHHWLGHWYMGGIRCFDRGVKADDMFKFYHEIFSIKPKEDSFAYTSYYLEIHAEPLTSIVCVKVGMPYQFTSPKVLDLNRPASRVIIPLLLIKNQYRFQVEAWGYNSTSSSEDDTLDFEYSMK
ncbi:unnamed protein product [Arctia plantaginis]|uniref:Peptidase S1 domain-containing protein n=1 Tax=Arctia plantaginis TaxID=874455 RepID=A0A8S0Z033_ARCPL|nr:unnamed protein product [Arctia plantaginis]